MEHREQHTGLVFLLLIGVLACMAFVAVRGFKVLVAQNEELGKTVTIKTPPAYIVTQPKGWDI